ncbi:unknown [Acidiphilium sp. CAG:727]|nr:unknown [Acidiphilium sp. CAG:727]
MYENHDCIGGIAGIVRKDDYDCNGRMDDITVTGQIYINVTAKSNKSLQPYIGGIIGKCEGGEHTNWSVREDIFVNQNNLVIVKWKDGFLNLTQHSFDQAKYIHRYVGYGDCVE